MFLELFSAFIIFFCVFFFFLILHLHNLVVYEDFQYFLVLYFLFFSSLLFSSFLFFVFRLFPIPINYNQPL